MPDDVTTICESAQKLVRDRDFAGAIELFEQAIAVDQAHAAAVEGLATANFLSGNLEAARDGFDKLTHVAPNLGRAYINLGAVCNRLEDYATAAKALRRGLQKERKSSQAYYNLGIAQKGLKQTSMAVSAYREAIRINPDMEEAHQNLGNCYLEMGSFRHAIECFEKALELRPGFDRAQHGIRLAKEGLEKAKRPSGGMGRLVDG